MTEFAESLASISDPYAAPELEFLFEARVKLQLPPMDVGPGPEGHRAIYLVKGGVFEGKIAFAHVDVERRALGVAGAQDGLGQGVL